MEDKITNKDIGQEQPSEKMEYDEGLTETESIAGLTQTTDSTEKAAGTKRKPEPSMSLETTSIGMESKSLTSTSEISCEKTDLGVVEKNECASDSALESTSGIGMESKSLTSAPENPCKRAYLEVVEKNERANDPTGESTSGVGMESKPSTSAPEIPCEKADLEVVEKNERASDPTGESTSGIGMESKPSTSAPEIPCEKADLEDVEKNEPASDPTRESLPAKSDLFSSFKGMFSPPKGAKTKVKIGARSKSSSSSPYDNWKFSKGIVKHRKTSSKVSKKTGVVEALKKHFGITPKSKSLNLSETANLVSNEELCKSETSSNVSEPDEKLVEIDDSGKQERKLYWVFPEEVLSPKLTEPGSDESESISEMASKLTTAEEGIGGSLSSFPELPDIQDQVPGSPEKGASLEDPEDDSKDNLTEDEPKK